MNAGQARRVVAVAGFGVAAVLPLFLGESSGALDNMVLAAAYVMMALGLNVVVGFAGLLDLGYVAFFAIGAHVAAHFGSAFWGIHLVRTKLLAYGVGAALGGVSGAFLASYLSIVNPHQFTFSFSIFILAMVVLGGLGSIWGVVVGAIVLSALNNYLLPRVLDDLPGSVGLDFDLSQVSSGIFGFLLVILMLLRPAGLLPERRHGLTLRQKAS